MKLSEREYKKCKNLVKLWERDFRNRENRAPSKEDIKSAHNDIREAYKQYWLVKTSILEETILDEETVPAVSPPPQGNYEESTIESTSILEKEVNKDSVWGEHLKNSVENKKDVIRKSSSFDFTEKLFKGVKLKISAKNFGLKKPKFRTPQTDLVSARTFECSISKDTTEVSPNVTEVSDTHKSTSETVEKEHHTELSLGKVKIFENKTKASVQPVNIVENLINSRGTSFKSKLDRGWLERCQQKSIEDTNTTLVKKNNTSSHENPFLFNEHSIPASEDIQSKCIESESKNNNCLNSDPCSDDDYVYSSDDEILSKLKSTSASMGQIISKPKTNRKRLGEEIPRPSKRLKSLTKAEEIQERKLNRLEEKLNNGTVDDNFVKIDLKRRRYARGKTTMTSTKYKVQQWKAKKKMGNLSRKNPDIGAVVLKCFRCGDVGHFMRACKKKQQDSLLPLEEGVEEDDSLFPTLEEAAAMVKEKNNSDPVSELEAILESSIADTDDDLKCVPPLYENQKNGTLIVTPDEVFEALEKFGHKNFRNGQERAVMRILSGKSTLVISGTGSGKSLCYQLPAYLYSQKYKCISLVISPLVSLMEDQILNFPPCLKAACLHTNQSTQVRQKVLKKIENNEIAVLLVSPEAMVSGGNGILGQTLVKNFPKIAFVCIDEVHCVSQWSHNFRTSYLMICKILRERHNIRTFLGLTATASKSSVESIIQHLNIEDYDSGVLQEDILPDNLILSVSKDESKDATLLELLKEPPFSEFDSIIIYCLRRIECERLASFLRTSLQNIRKKPLMFGERSSISSDVEVYHAGISAAKRKKVQNHFMRGKLRIVIATVAFGMGINKADIRGIIHYNMPRTFEHYVQEIGRAGRDGLIARCHLLYDHQGNDLPELKRHIHRDTLDRPTIRELLFKVFPRCSCKNTCRKHEVAFSVEDTVKQLDLAQENISTLLCYLESLPEKSIEVLPPTYTKCTIISYNGSIALKRAARKCPALAFAIAAHCNSAKTTKVANKLEFSVIELADTIGWDCGLVKRELKRCEWTQVEDRYKRTGIGVSFHDLGFHIRSPGNLSDEQLDNALNTLYNRVKSLEQTALYQLKICDQAFSSVAYDNIHDIMNECEDLHERDKKLKKVVRSYFSEEDTLNDAESAEINVVEERHVVNNIHKLVSSYRDHTFNALSIARIFHGIESPNFPSLMWARTPYWRCALAEDFNALYRLACRELIKFR